MFTAPSQTTCSKFDRGCFHRNKESVSRHISKQQDCAFNELEVVEQFRQFAKNTFDCEFDFGVFHFSRADTKEISVCDCDYVHTLL